LPDVLFTHFLANHPDEQLPLVSILSVGRFHLKRVMHLEHGQMSQRGQLLENSNTARQTQGTKLDIFSGEMRMRDFFFHETTDWDIWC